MTLKAEIKSELYEKKIEKQAKLLREYRNLVKLSNSKDFFNIPSVNILESELSAIDKQIKEAENTPLESQDKTTADYSENQKLFFGIKKFIINRFGLPADVSFNKCPKVTYFEIYELIKSFASQQRDIVPTYPKKLIKSSSGNVDILNTILNKLTPAMEIEATNEILNNFMDYLEENTLDIVYNNEEQGRDYLINQYCK